MITIDEAKQLAKRLSNPPALSHSRVLEEVAQVAGCRDWNTFAARAAGGGQQAGDPVGRQGVIPILRIFDADMARQFYVDVLGFAWQWEHRFQPDMPLYAQVERDGRVLHLSEHHEDATPGSAAMIIVDDVHALAAQVTRRAGNRVRPEVEAADWGQTLTVPDPFGNRLVFWQRS